MRIFWALAPLALGVLSACGAEEAEVPDNLVKLDEGVINPDCELAKNALRGSYEYKNREHDKLHPEAKGATVDTTVLARCRLGGAGAFLARRDNETWYFLPRTDNIFSFDPRMIYISDNGTERWISEQDSSPASAKQTTELQRLFAASKEVK